MPFVHRQLPHDLHDLVKRRRAVKTLRLQERPPAELEKGEEQGGGGEPVPDASRRVATGVSPGNDRRWSPYRAT